MTYNQNLLEAINYLNENCKYDLAKCTISNEKRITNFRELTLDDLYNFKIYENACHIEFYDFDFLCKNEMEFFTIHLPEFQKSEEDNYDNKEDSENAYAAELMLYITNPLKNIQYNTNFKYQKIGLVRFYGGDFLTKDKNKEHNWRNTLITQEQATLLNTFIYLCKEDNIDKTINLAEYVQTRESYLLHKKLNQELSLNTHKLNKKTKI